MRNLNQMRAAARMGQLLCRGTVAAGVMRLAARVAAAEAAAQASRGGGDSVTQSQLSGADLHRASFATSSTAAGLQGVGAARSYSQAARSYSQQAADLGMGPAASGGPPPPPPSALRVLAGGDSSSGPAAAAAAPCTSNLAEADAGRTLSASHRVSLAGGLHTSRLLRQALAQSSDACERIMATLLPCLAFVPLPTGGDGRASASRTAPLQSAEAASRSSTYLVTAVAHGLLARASASARPRDA